MYQLHTREGHSHLVCVTAAIKPEHAQSINRSGVISFLKNDFRIYDFETEGS